MAARINSASIRRVNLVRVFHALRRHPNSSQTELQRLTGLDKATTSMVVTQMLEEGLLARREPVSVGRVGRPESALSISPAAGIFVGARLEPRKIRLITTDLAGSPLQRLTISGSTDIHQAMALLHEGYTEIVRASGPELIVRGIGVGVPALMDLAGGLVLAPNLGWQSLPIQPLLQENLEAPVYVDNDANAAAMAERLFGACQHSEHFVYLSCHSGIGAGLFLEGRLYRGSQGLSGEIGHLTVVDQGRPCGCGKRGCLETYTSEAGILRTLSERGRCYEDLVEVAQAAAKQDAIVLEQLDEVGHYLGLGLSSLVNLLNPEMVVLGGTLSNVFEFLKDGLLRTMDAHTMAPHRAAIRVILSPLGAEVVPMGGIALAMDGYLSAPHLDTSLRSSRLKA
jgi:predicted NBD/HSP70 family sugar kinase